MCFSLYMVSDSDVFLSGMVMCFSLYVDSDVFLSTW